MKIVFGGQDNMFRLAAAALAPSSAGDRFLADYFRPEGADGPHLVRGWAANYRLPANIRVVLCDDEPAFVHELAYADMIIIEKQHLTEAHLRGANALKLVQVFGRNLNGIDLPACARRHVQVSAIDRPSNRRVAEQALMLMFALTHDLDEARRGFNRPSPLPPSGWAYNWAGCKSVRGLVGCTVGLIGFGEIGQLVAEYLKPLHVQLLYTRRQRDPQAEADTGATFASLDTVVANSDILSLHVPGVAANKHLLDAGMLAKAKPGAFIVNTSRGSVIDEAALAEALRTRRIAGAGLDVFALEPLPADHPLRRLGNVILTPHVSAGTRDEHWIEGEIGPIIRAAIEIGRAMGQ
jgi:phosphoglycerate dehydrogenase-like enzyme